jgi:hypothetical protein
MPLTVSDCAGIPMPSGKDRLYLTLHVRGGPGFHCGFLLSPKAENNNTTSYAFDITNIIRPTGTDPVTGAPVVLTPPGAWWHRMPRPVKPAESRALVARILITKLLKGMVGHLENEFRNVEITPEMTCYTWSLAALKHLRNIGYSSVPDPDEHFQTEVLKFGQSASMALLTDPPSLVIEVAVQSSPPAKVKLTIYNCDRT